MKYKLITVLYLCVCASLVVRGDEHDEEEESGSGEEDESAEEVKYILSAFSPNLKTFILLAISTTCTHARSLARAHA